MTAQELKEMNTEDALEFIRETLRIKGPNGEKLYIKRFEDDKEFIEYHDRFEMSGYEANPGECTLHNQAILNKFAFLGIYDYTDYLFLDFYKGCGTLYLQYFQTEERYSSEDSFSGLSTSQIIYEVFRVTIFSDKRERRRD